MLQRMILGCLFLTLGAGPALAVPEQIDVQGFLRAADGLPVDAEGLSVTFRLYAAPDDVMPLWSETQTLDVDAGALDALVPEDPTAAPFSDELFTHLALGGAVWLTVEAAGQGELPPVKLVSVPYALHAAVAGSAKALDCPGCIGPSQIDADAVLVASGIAYDPTASGLSATTAQQAIDALDYGLDQHAQDADAHHDALSDGYHITPASVTVGDTKLTDGQLDFGAEADDALTAAMVTTLTGGAESNADALHTHAGLSSGGGGACVTLYGSAAPQCPSGYSAAQRGSAVFPVLINTGIGSAVCAAVPTTTNRGANSVYWYGMGSYIDSYIAPPLPCVVCCPAAQVTTGCYPIVFADGAPDDVSGCATPTSQMDYALTAHAGRTYKLTSVELWVWSSYIPSQSNWDIRVANVADDTELARVKALPVSSATGCVCTPGCNAGYVKYRIHGDLDLGITATTTLRFTVVNANTGALVTNQILSGVDLNGCIE